MHYCPFRHFPHPRIATQVGFVRLACLIHAANVRSEPGSNPSKFVRLSVTDNPGLRFRLVVTFCELKKNLRSLDLVDSKIAL